MDELFAFTKSKRSHDATRYDDDHQPQRAAKKQATPRPPPQPLQPPRSADANPAAASADAAPAAVAVASASASAAAAASAVESGPSAPPLKSCKHEVAMPAGAEPTDDMRALVVPAGREPARSYKFELDPFQKAAVASIEREESVLVSAHTSAGKTVCAEYAIAVSLRDKQRVIYTSPIKALSNQKYRELSEEFGDVGLMTGDYTINIDASCLVMTTEILRSMLYRGSEVMREVKWVIFDEVHYMRDRERGVVWEEVIILLPHSVRYVFLSATIPNAPQFADWIAYLHQQPCHVVYTDYRPTPLQHYLFGAGSNGFHLVVNEKSQFQPAAFEKATTSLGKGEGARATAEFSRRGKGGGKGGGGGRGGGRGGKGGDKSDCYKLVKTIVKRNMQPLIVFAFGKKMVETLARQMGPLELNTAEERESVSAIFENAVQTLSEDDQTLPQVTQMLPLLQRGVAVHHSGLLPLLKELVEILFQEGLVKLLFATETFAMGLNMPAKTVIFADLSKFDGSTFRCLTSGEYIQMSGRAGRRGLDDRGSVITMVDQATDLEAVREMLRGSADELNSRFHLSYNMLLNCNRMETADIELLISKSFRTFQLQSEVPALEERMLALEERLASDAEVAVPDEVALLERLGVERRIEAQRCILRPMMQRPSTVLPFLQSGRLVRLGPLPVGKIGRGHKGALTNAESTGVKEADEDGLCGGALHGWGVIVGYSKKSTASGSDKADCIVEVLIRTGVGAARAMEVGQPPAPPPATDDDESTEVHVVRTGLENVDALSSVRINMPADLKRSDQRHEVLKVIRQVERRFPDAVPELDPIKDLRINESDAKPVMLKLEELHESLPASGMNRAALMAAKPVLRARQALADEVRRLKRTIRKNQSAGMKDELRGMARVLRRLGFVSAEGVVENKGRVACEVSTSDELLTTELVFAGVFQQLEPSEIAALLSCLVTEHGFSKEAKGGGEDDALAIIRTASMRPHVRELRELAKRIATVIADAKLTIVIDEYVEQFSPGLVDIVYDWCHGAKFADLCRMTDAYEGSIIRAMHRLEELLRQLVDAAKVVGNEELRVKCDAARKLLVRDVVFCPSLYT